MKSVLTLLLTAVLSHGFSQETITFSGKVLDSKTNMPLINASIGLKKYPYSTTTDEQGYFEFLLPSNVLDDTIFISYVGYTPFADKVTNLTTSYQFYRLDESSILLDEVVILEQRMYKFEIKKLEGSMKLVKGNLYACQTEVTNKEYNQFLGYLLRSNQKSLYKRYKPDISNYEGPILTFFKGYHYPQFESKETKYNKGYGDYPIVNVSYEAAEAYCEWFSDLYNTTKGKKKFRQVKFRLPKLKEYRMAALGYKKFQLWELDENLVEVRMPSDSATEKGIGNHLIIKASDIDYPWYGSYNYRRKTQNKRNCWMGNFKVPANSIPCEVRKEAGDGYLFTSPVAMYFPNGMGLFDIVGDAAEMIDEKGKACGGSWDQYPKESTIRSVSTYSGPTGSVGFRVFMEVVDEKADQK